MISQLCLEACSSSSRQSLIRTDKTNLLSLLIGLRAKLREKKEFALSGSIRDRPAKLGITLKDTAQDTIWT